MAQADGGGVLSRDRSVSGAALLSALLHVGAAVLLITFQAAPGSEEMPEPLPIEIILEAPSASAPADIPPAPAAVQQPAPARPVVREASTPRPRFVQVAKPAVPSAAPSVAPSEPGEMAVPAPSQAQAAAPAAAPVAAPAAEVVDYGAYVGRLHERIASHRIYPPQAMRRREEGDVRLRVLLAGDGTLVDILSLAEASAQLTQAARQAIESAAPFDPPPRGGDGERRLAFDVTVAFRLR